MKCLHCGNTETFTGTRKAYGDARYTRIDVVELDTDKCVEETISYGDDELDGSEDIEYDEPDEIKCGVCASMNIDEDYEGEYYDGKTKSQIQADIIRGLTQ